MEIEIIYEYVVAINLQSFCNFTNYAVCEISRPQYYYEKYFFRAKSLNNLLFLGILSLKGVVFGQTISYALKNIMVS